MCYTYSMRNVRILISITLSTLVTFFVGVFLVSAEDTSSTPVVNPSTALSTSTLAQLKGDSDEIQVLNQEIAARKDKIKQLEQTIADYNKNISQKQSQAVSLKNQLSILDSRIGEAQADLDLTNEKIKQTELEIAALQNQIDTKNTQIAKQKRVIASMVESIHSADQKGILEIMLTYDNFSDFYNEVKNTESVYVDLGRSVHALKAIKDDLTVKQNQQTQKKATYVALKGQLQDKRQKLAEEQGYKQTLLTETKSSEAKYQTLLASLKQQYQVIEKEQATFEAQLRKKLESENKIKPNGAVSFVWPVPSHIINAGFHDKEYPFIKVFQHSGLDLKAPYGTPVKAAAAGYVAVAKRCTTASCYSYILIVHNGTISSVYGHLSGLLATTNQYVKQGEVIGMSGGTPGTVGAGPFVTGPHLHFEVRVNGIPVDPVPYIQ